MTLNIQTEIEQVKAGLPDFEQALNSIDDSFNRIFSELESALSNTQDRIQDSIELIDIDFHEQASDFPYSFGDDLEGSCEALEAEIDDIKSQAESVAQTLEELVGASQEFMDAVSNVETEFLEQAEVLKGQFEGRAENVNALVVGKFEDLVEFKDEACAKFLASFEEAIDNELKAGFESISDDAIACLDNCRDLCLGFVDDSSEQLSSTIESVFAQSVDNAKNRLESRLKETGEHVKGEIIREVKEEALSMVLTTHLGAQVTTMIQPYLPQLMVANMLAPSIQSALKIMRMGF